MKKIIFIIIPVVLVLILAFREACTEEEVFDPVKTILTNKEKETFDVSRSTKKVSIQDAENLELTDVYLAGKSYSMPISISKLIEDGWTLDGDIDGTISGGKYTNIIPPPHLTSPDGNFEIAVQQVTAISNGTDSLENCYLSEFSVHISEGEEYDFVLPGNITAEITALDVLTAFGSPYEKNGPFSPKSENGEDLLRYSDHKKTGISYIFYFNEDGTVKSIYFKHNK